MRIPIQTKKYNIVLCNTLSGLAPGLITPVWPPIGMLRELETLYITHGSMRLYLDLVMKTVDAFSDVRLRVPLLEQNPWKFFCIPWEGQRRQKQG